MTDLRGLFGKFIVRRIDGTDAPGEKHDGCNYFVLDMNHDPHAIPALRAYAKSCAIERPTLSLDLTSIADGNKMMVERPSIDLLRSAPASATPEPRCRWSIDDVGGDSVYETQCGHSFYFDDSTSTGENGFQFCAYCGGRLVEVKTSEETEVQSAPALKQAVFLYLNTLTITSDNIGDIRRSLFMPYDCRWNGWVRDMTAELENQSSAPRLSQHRQEDL